MGLISRVSSRTYRIMLRLNRIAIRQTSLFNVKPVSQDQRYTDNSAVEVAVNLSDLKENEAEFAKNYLHKFLSSDGRALLTFSDKSRYQLENTRLAVKRAKHFVATVTPKNTLNLSLTVLFFA